MKTVTIVGLGYIGLPLACLCAKKGYKVCGLDNDEEKVILVNKNKNPINMEKLDGQINATTNAGECIPTSDIVVICVPTPANNNVPDLTIFKEAVSTVSKFIAQNTLLIIESTIYPGTTEEIVIPILKKNNINPTKDILVAHSPERIDPGNEKWTIENLPRVVGGFTEEATKKTIEFYKSIVNADIVRLSDIKSAEATKIMENTFRDVNIAFMNEMAKSFDRIGIDILEVIKGASTKPYAFMPHYPGAGVGGHCIAQDPYYMIEKGRLLGFNHSFLMLAREINNSMPYYVVGLLEQELEKIGKKIENAKVGVLGLAYKGEVSDTRISPAFNIIDILKVKGANILVFDPYVKKGCDVKSTNELLERSDYIVLVTDHNEFKRIDSNKLKDNNILIVIDGRNCLDKEKIKSKGILYHGIGRY